MRKYYLYSLNDPNSNTPKYIGVSNNPERRFSEHLEDKSITKKTKWINSLKDGGNIPILKVLKETSSIREVLDWEIETIKDYKEIYNLVNTTAGGEYYGIGTPIQVFTLEGDYLDSYTSMIEYTELFNLPETAVSSISSVCLRKRNYAYNRIFRYLNDTVTSDDLDRLNKSLTSNTYKHFFIFTPSGKLLGEFETIQEAVEAGFGSRSGISMALKGNSRYSYKGNILCYSIEEFNTRLEKFKKGKSKGKLENGISKYDLDGNYLDTYYSVSDAVKSTGNSNHSLIKDCCEGIYKQAFGFQWRYGISKENVGKYVKTYDSSNRTKKVQQFDKDNNLIKEWASAQEAADFLNKSANSIRAAAKGSKKTAYGYIWKYV